MGKKTYSETVTCRHCYNIAPMEILGNVTNPDPEEEFGRSYSGGDVYQVIKCPACTKINIRIYYWSDYMDSDDHVNYNHIYPEKKRFPQGLPPKILELYEKAEKVKLIGAEFYTIALRKVLELVCIDKGAEKFNLTAKMKELADNGELPLNLVKVAEGLNQLGCIGVHPEKGELTAEEVPIADALCRALLESIYTAPYLSDIAEKRLQSIGKPKAAKKIKK